MGETVPSLGDGSLPAGVGSQAWGQEMDVRGCLQGPQEGSQRNEQKITTRRGEEGTPGCMETWSKCS